MARTALAGLGFAAILASASLIADNPPKEVTGRQWLLLKLDGETVDSTIRSTINFAPDGRASGASGCNRWFGTAVFDGSSLRFSQVGATRMACGKPAMDREAAFTRMLGLVRSWKLNGTDLTLAGEDDANIALLRAESPSGGKK